jgi:peptidyl-prolyl cis-trans isomerase SurA
MGLAAALRLRFLAALLALAAGVPAAAQSQFEPAAIVNDAPVTRYDVAQRSRLLVLNGAPRDADLSAIALEQLIEEQVKRGAARAVGIEANPAELEQIVADYAAQRNVSVADLERRLAGAGVARESLTDALSVELMWRDLIRRRFGPRGEPSEAEIDQELSLIAAGQSRSYRLSEIVLPFAARGEAATLRLAADLTARLNAGASFAAAARANSASPSGPQGGDIGWVPEGSLPAPVAAAVASLSPGQVTDPIPVQGAVALLRLEEVRTESRDNVTVTVSFVAIEAQGAAGAAALAEFVARPAPGCGGVAEQARAAGLNTQPGGPMSLANVNPAFQAVIGALEPGEISAPTAVPGGQVAFLLCERSSGATAEDREALRQQLRQRRMVGFANGYLQELRGDAVIELR